jgi:hypothetical protein
MTTSRNPGAEQPGEPETQEERQRLFEEWVTTLRRKGAGGSLKPPVPLAVQEAIRASAPPPSPGDEGKTQVYKVPEEAKARIAEREKLERAEVETAALAALDVAQTQVYRIPDNVVARAKERQQASRVSAPVPPVETSASGDSEPPPDPDSIATDRPPSMPADDHTAVFVPPPDLLARAQRHLEQLAAEEAARAAQGVSAGSGAKSDDDQGDQSLVDALAAEGDFDPTVLPTGASLSEDEVAATKVSTAQFAAQKAPQLAQSQAPVAVAATTLASVRHDSMSKELASMRPRYVGYVGWGSVILLLAGVGYAVMTTLR